LIYRKSTTISLLLRFYDSIRGQIFLDNHDIKTLNVNWLRSMIGFVQQEPILFDRTVAENIAYGIQDRQVPLEEIQDAARQANIHQEIIEFPQVKFLFYKKKNFFINNYRVMKQTVVMLEIVN
jgi:ATP-binding cassette subfamily B (MDR/TAP) protein 1